MRRQAVSTCLRILSRDLASEASLGGAATLTRALSTAAVAPAASRLAGQAQGALRPAVAATGLAPPSARSQSDASSSWNTILYPDSELEIGSPAPDFKLTGESDAGRGVLLGFGRCSLLLLPPILML